VLKNALRIRPPAVASQATEEEFMIIRTLMSSVAALAFVAAASAPAQAVSIAYAEWLASLVEPGIAAYEAASGEKVDAIKLPNQGFDTRIPLDLSAGTAADVVAVDSFMVSELASSGYLEPLDALGGSWDQYQYYMKGIVDVVSYDGHVYALPTDTDVRMLWYSKALFAQAGIEVPWTPKSWDEVIAAAEKIKALGIDDAFVVPAGTKQGEAATMQGFYMALLGADVPTDDRNRLRNREQGKWIGDSPGLRRTLQFYHDVYVGKKLGTSAINYATDPGAATREAITGGKLGILASGSWENVCFWDCNGVNLPTQDERDQIVGWTPWPGSGLPGTMATTNISGGWAIGINAKAADKDKAGQLLLAIFDAANFGKWTVDNRRMAVRTDISESDAYTSDPYLAEATKLAATTTGRDTFPGYQIVSGLVQQMTADILDGGAVEDVITEYHAALVDEFGEENVITYE
jgi:multiple sugar transport system substrate-binding protein